MSEQANGLTEPKLFPILLGYEAKQIGPHPTCIPWSVAELAYSSYVRQFGRCQTLERIADRGGFSPNEMDEFVPDWRERSSEITSLRARAEQAEKKLAAERKQTDKACEIMHKAVGDHGPDVDDTGCGCRMKTVDYLAEEVSRRLEQAESIAEAAKLFYLGKIDARTLEQQIAGALARAGEKKA